MKLLNKISYYFLVSSLLVFFVMFYLIYILMYQAIEFNTDKHLKNILHKVVHNLKKEKDVAYYNLVEINEVDSCDENLIGKYSIQDAKYIVDEDNNIETFRELVSYVKVKNSIYKITLRASILEKELFLRDILVIASISYILLIIILFYLNKTISKKILRDFYNTLDKISKFKLNERKRIIFDKSNIYEFDQLNQKIQFLIDNIIREYNTLKQFSDETNHEIQTPISIIKSKMELLLQNVELKEQDLCNIKIMLNNIKKLEKLSKSLLLLNKLETQEFFNKNLINLSEEIMSVLDEFEEMLVFKGIKLIKNIINDFYIKANESLISILITNIITNAIKYNVEKGEILVCLENNELVVSNTVENLSENPDKFFNRFYRSKKENDDIVGVGLGLSIAKKICEMYDFDITNGYENNFYFIKINFKTTEKI